MSELVLEGRDVHKRFEQGSLCVDVLQGVNIRVEQGQRVAIMGASGSGKSTLLHLLGGLDAPTRGRIVLDGQELATLSERSLAALRNRALGFVYQFHHLLGEFTLLENIAMPLLIGNVPVAEARERANTILGRVGLGHRIEHKPSELSGGERQRAAVARALVTRPKCVLADEPTGNLDRKTAGDVYRLMLELNEEYRVSFLVVTHDAALARQMDRTYFLEDGRISGGQDTLP